MYLVCSLCFSLISCQHVKIARSSLWWIAALCLSATLLKSMLSLPDDKVVYKLPSQVAVCQDTVIRDVIGGEELERHLSLSYLHPGLSPAPPSSLLSHLGVRNLRGSDVTTVTTAMAKELMKAEGIHSGVCIRGHNSTVVCVHCRNTDALLQW